LLDRSYIKPVAQNILIAKRWNFLGWFLSVQN
jgi:hypothetical protein